MKYLQLHSTQPANLILEVAPLGHVAVQKSLQQHNLAANHTSIMWEQRITAVHSPPPRTASLRLFQCFTNGDTMLLSRWQRCM